MNPLLEYFLRVTAIFALAFAATRIPSRHSAALRHVIWICAFSIAAATPLLMQFGPRIQIQSQSPAAVAQTPPAAISPENRPLQYSSPAPHPREIPILEILWLAGMLPFGIRIAIAVRKSRALLKKIVVLEGVAGVRLAGVHVAETGAVATAMTLGVLRPWILLPLAHRQWDPELRRLVLLHELAHVRRRDCLTQWLPNLVCAVHWFNPLAWLARSEMLCEAERACDDAVIRSGVNGSAFARDLVEIARTIQSKGDSLMSIAVTTKLERRIRRLVDPSANRRALTAGRALAAATLALALLIPIAGVRAQEAAAARIAATEPAPKVPPVVVAQARPVPPALAAQVQLAQAAPAPATQPAPAPQPSATGSISGTVSDPTGAVIAGATVQLEIREATTSPTPSIALTTVADPIGRWSFSNLPSGIYRVGISVPGFAAFAKTVSVNPGSNTTVLSNLVLGRIGESVTVTAARTTPAPSPTSTTPQKPIRVGGNVQPPRLLRHPSPVFPQIARDQGIQGTVTFEAIINKTGGISEARLVPSSAPPEMVQAAREAIEQWQYSPALLNGEPVEVITEITVNFTLQ